MKEAPPQSFLLADSHGACPFICLKSTSCRNAHRRLLGAQINSKYRVLNYAWEVTPAAAAQGGRGATTELFAPVQGFFQVPRISDLRVRLQPL